MEMSLNQYILNPALKTNALLNASTRELIKASYEKKFDQVMVKENGKVQYYLFTEADKNVYWAYIKVPSEIVHNFYYDVIFKFIPTSSTGFFDDLFKFNMQVFSNDPSFVFTYAYVFNKNNLFIKELASKMGREPLKDKPEEKNSLEQIGYEKAIYFAYLIMRERKLNKLLRFKSEAKQLDIKFILENVMPAEEKIQLRQEEGKKYSGKKKAIISKTAFKGLTQGLSREQKQQIATSNIRVSEKVKSVGTIKKVKSTKMIKPNHKK